MTSSKPFVAIRSYASLLSLAAYRFGIENGRVPSCEHSLRKLMCVWCHWSCKLSPMMTHLRMVPWVSHPFVASSWGRFMACGYHNIFFQFPTLSWCFPDAFLFHFIPRTPTSICTKWLLWSFIIIGLGIASHISHWIGAVGYVSICSWLCPRTFPFISGHYPLE